MRTLTLFTAFPFFVLATHQRAAAFSITLARDINTALPTENNVVGTRRARRGGRISMLSSPPKDDADGGGGGGGSGGLNKKLDGRKNRVVRGYQAMLFAYVVQGLLATARAGGAASILPIVAGQVVMPAGVSRVMISAARHDRLGSDTYKRLNLALLQYGLIGLLALSLGGGTIDRPLAVGVLPLALSVVNPVKGYAYGVLGWNKDRSDAKLMGDFMYGTKTTVTGFFSKPKNLKAVGYTAATATVASMKLLRLREVLEFFPAKSPSSGELATALARFNRLAFLSLMLYTLGDAADRDRLGGTTFVQLNYLCALSMAVHGLYFAGGIATPLGALSAIFGAFCAFNGVSSQRSK